MCWTNKIMTPVYAILYLVSNIDEIYYSRSYTFNSQFTILFKAMRVPFKSIYFDFT